MGSVFEAQGESIHRTVQLMIRSRDSDDRLHVFIHIPKTAGTSFNTLLTREFGANNILHAPDSAQDSGFSYYQSLASIEQAGVHLLRGHILHGIDHYVDREVKYFTILRDPISRIRSYLNHMASEAAAHPLVETPWYKAVRDWRDAEHYMKRRPYDIDNYAVRALSGIDFPPGQCSERHLLKAKENLDKMRAFGIQERLAESAVLLAKEFSWGVIPVLSRTKSKNPTRIRLSQNDVRALKDRNFFDQELYRYAVERFDHLVSVNSMVRIRGFVYSKATPLVTLTEKAVRAVRGR